MGKSQTRDLVYMAFYVAVFMVLDTFVNTLQILQMPEGGSLGVSTIALLLASYHLGWKKGMLVSIVSVFAQFVTGPMFTPDLLGFMLDYFFAFSVYGLASLFPNVGYFFTGVLMTNLIRFVLHTISGIIIWNTPLWGSVAYQSTYMIPTAVFGLILVPLVYRTLESFFKK